LSTESLNEFWKEVSEDGLPESVGIDGKPKCGKMPKDFSIPKTGMQQQGIAVIGERKLVSPWPGNGLKRQRKKEEEEVLPSPCHTHKNSILL